MSRSRLHTLRFVAANEGAHRCMISWRDGDAERLVKDGLITAERYFLDGASMPATFANCRLTANGRAVLEAEGES